MLPVVRRFFLGPWPIHAGALWTFLSAMILGVFWRLFGPQPMIAQTAPLSQRVLALVAIGVLAPGLALVPLIVYRRLRGRFTDRAMGSAEYLLSLAGACVIVGIVLNWVLRNSAEFQQVLNSPRLIDTAVRIFVPILIINAVIGTIFARIQKESDTAKDALQTVVAQRRLLLESEERVRGQVAAFLHDRVQTDLVSIALRIRATIGQTPEVMTSELNSVITDLERVRSQEVRRASRQLSPNLATVSFDTALRELADSYRPAMDVAINVHDSVAYRIEQCDDDSRATALYRICEQGLLNAAIHGLATECSIQVTLTPRDELVLHLTDNGIGLQGKPAQPGMGSTVISAWVESLGGHWALESAASGMTLTATFPCA
jgi:glucose-6-phosphate-specific signal transduction histidine kinase